MTPQNKLGENLFKCDWCNKIFAYDTLELKHLCELNIPEVGIGKLDKNGMPILEPEHIIRLAPINTKPLNHE